MATRVMSENNTLIVEFQQTKTQYLFIGGALQTSITIFDNGASSCCRLQAADPAHYGEMGIQLGYPVHGTNWRMVALAHELIHLLLAEHAGWPRSPSAFHDADPSLGIAGVQWDDDLTNQLHCWLKGGGDRPEELPRTTCNLIALDSADLNRKLVRYVHP